MERIKLEVLDTPDAVRKTPLYNGATAYKTPLNTTQLALVRIAITDMYSGRISNTHDQHISKRVRELIKKGVPVLVYVPESKKWGPACVYEAQGVDQMGRIVFPSAVSKYISDAIAMYRSRIVVEKDTDFLDNDLIKDANMDEVSPLERILPKY